MAEIMIRGRELQDEAMELRKLNSAFKDKISELATQEATLKSQWEGEANEEFHMAFMDDQKYMEKFVEEIERYCSTLEEIAQKYRNVEKENWKTAHERW